MISEHKKVPSLSLDKLKTLIESYPEPWSLILECNNEGAYIIRDILTKSYYIEYLGYLYGVPVILNKSSINNLAIKTGRIM